MTGEPTRGVCMTTSALNATLGETGAQSVRLTPACHQAAGVDLTYQGAGVMLVHCHRCHQEVARLAVGGAQPRGREEA